MKIYILPLLFTLFSLGFKLSAQEYEKVNGAWNAVFLDYPLSNKFTFRNEFHFRTVSYLEILNQQIIRPSITYTTPKKIKLTGGYSFLKNFDRNIDANPRVRQEHNIWEQISYSLPLKKGTINSWIRMEHRYQEELPLEKDSKSFNFSSRIRFRFTYSYPLSKPDSKTPINFVFYEEIFTFLNPEGIPYRFNQSWTFFGIKIKLSDKMVLNSGFQKTTSQKSSGDFLKNRLWNTILFYKL
jgi:hypothetical protein